MQVTNIDLLTTASRKSPIFSPDKWFKVILLGKSMLPLEEPPLTRQQFAICFAQSEAELSLDLLLVSCCVGSEFLSSIHKNFEARVLKVFTNKSLTHKHNKQLTHKQGTALPDKLLLHCKSDSPHTLSNFVYDLQALSSVQA